MVCRCVLYLLPRAYTNFVTLSMQASFRFQSQAYLTHLQYISYSSLLPESLTNGFSAIFMIDQVWRNEEPEVRASSLLTPFFSLSLLAMSYPCLHSCRECIFGPICRLMQASYATMQKSAALLPFTASV